MYTKPKYLDSRWRGIAFSLEKGYQISHMIPQFSHLNNCMILKGCSTFRIRAYKGHVIKSFDFTGQTSPLETTQLCCHSLKAATDDTWTSGCGCSTIKLYLKIGVGQAPASSLLTPAAKVQLINGDSVAKWIWKRLQHIC